MLEAEKVAVSIVNRKTTLGTYLSEVEGFMGYAGDTLDGLGSAASAAYDLAGAANTTAGNAIPSSQKGAANGVASLDSGGKVPNAQLPSFVSSVNGNSGAVQITDISGSSAAVNGIRLQVTEGKLQYSTDSGQTWQEVEGMGEGHNIYSQTLLENANRESLDWAFRMADKDGVAGKVLTEAFNISFMSVGAPPTIEDLPTLSAVFASSLATELGQYADLWERLSSSPYAMDQITGNSGDTGIASIFSYSAGYDAVAKNNPAFLGSDYISDSSMSRALAVLLNKTPNSSFTTVISTTANVNTIFNNYGMTALVTGRPAAMTRIYNLGNTALNYFFACVHPFIGQGFVNSPLCPSNMLTLFPNKNYDTWTKVLTRINELVTNSGATYSDGLKASGGLAEKLFNTVNGLRRVAAYPSILSYSISNPAYSILTDAYFDAALAVCAANSSTFPRKALNGYNNNSSTYFYANPAISASWYMEGGNVPDVALIFIKRWRFTSSSGILSGSGTQISYSSTVGTASFELKALKVGILQGRYFNQEYNWPASANNYGECFQVTPLTA
jgi:hypothetical protein